MPPELSIAHGVRDIMGSLLCWAGLRRRQIKCLANEKLEIAVVLHLHFFFFQELPLGWLMTQWL